MGKYFLSKRTSVLSVLDAEAVTGVHVHVSKCMYPQRQSRCGRKVNVITSINVFGIAKTWLEPSISDGELAIDHYNWLRKDRLHRHGGGVCVCYHESLRVQRRTDLESDDLEIRWPDVGSCVGIGCGYRPPHMPQTY